MQRVDSDTGGNIQPRGSNRSDTIRQQVGSQVASTADGTTDAPAISGAVMQTITRSNSTGPNAMTEREALSVLMGTSLTRADYDYIVKNSQHATIKDWAASSL
jgi:hypothetical protein